MQTFVLKISEEKFLEKLFVVIVLLCNTFCGDIHYNNKNIIIKNSWNMETLKVPVSQKRFSVLIITR